MLVNAPTWATYKTAMWLSLGSFSAFSIYAALQLRFIWKPASVTLAKIAVASWPIASVIIAVVIPKMIFTGQALTPDSNGIVQFLVSIIAATIWIIYLSISKRCVQRMPTKLWMKSLSTPVSTKIFNSQYDNALSNETANASIQQTSPTVSQQPEAHHQGLPAAPTVAQPNDNFLAATNSAANEDELYEKIGLELDSGTTHTATWLKAFAQANGDENVAKAGYIKLRIRSYWLTA